MHLFCRRKTPVKYTCFVKVKDRKDKVNDTTAENVTTQPHESLKEAKP